MGVLMTIQRQIETQLTGLMDPELLEVSNESNQHSVLSNSETHFRVVIVSDCFTGQRKVTRHQQVYGALSVQLQGPVHALALHTYTPGEWRERQQLAPESPACHGASKAD